MPLILNNKKNRISLTQGKIEVFIHFSINTRALSSLLPALNVILYVLTKRLFCYILPRSSIIVQIFAIVLKLTSVNIFHFMVKIVYSHVHLSQTRRFSSLHQNQLKSIKAMLDKNLRIY